MPKERNKADGYREKAYEVERAHIFIKRLVRKNFERFAQQWGCTRPLDDKPYLKQKK